MRRCARAFTLVELLVAVVVVTILAAVAVPKAASSTRRAKESALRQTLTQLRNAQVQFHVLYEAYPNALSDFTNPNPPLRVWTDSISPKLWGTRVYRGALLQPGVAQSSNLILDPVSGNNFSVSRLANGELRIRSSATGRDSRGVRFSTY
ncbi:MAG: prepilin-type N-terminal cleavage/methylation domain-containing protein [Armatimonadota bacterium]